MAEALRPVPGWPGYLVTDAGRMFSDWRMVSWRLDGDGKRVVTYEARASHRHEMYGKVNRAGYRVVQLRRPGGCKTALVHVLVLEAHVGPKPSGCQCRHLDGDRINNRLSNLQWGTPEENQRDRMPHGTSNSGRRACVPKVTAQDVLAIRAACAEGVSLSTLAKQYGITVPGVSRIKNGKSWRHIGGAHGRTQ